MAGCLLDLVARTLKKGPPLGRALFLTGRCSPGCDVLTAALYVRRCETSAPWARQGALLLVLSTVVMRFVAVGARCWRSRRNGELAHA